MRRTHPNDTTTIGPARGTDKSPPKLPGCTPPFDRLDQEQHQRTTDARLSCVTFVQVKETPLCMAAVTTRACCVARPGVHAPIVVSGLTTCQTCHCLWWKIMCSLLRCLSRGPGPQPLGTVSSSLRCLLKEELDQILAASLQPSGSSISLCSQQLVPKGSVLSPPKCCKDTRRCMIPSRTGLRRVSMGNLFRDMSRG